MKAPSRVVQGPPSALRGAWDPNVSSGSVDYLLGPNARPLPFASRQQFNLCSLLLRDPMPMVLSVDNFLISTRTDLGLNAATAIGTSTATVDGGYEGRLKVTYGSGNMSKTRYLDVRGGNYQLPPCQYARVVLERWDISTLAVNYTATCVASLVVGTIPYPTEPTVTARAWPNVAAATNITMTPILGCPGAVYYTIGSNDPAGVADVASLGDVLDAGHVDTASRSRYPSYPRWQMAPAARGNDVIVTAAAIAAGYDMYLMFFHEW